MKKAGYLMLFFSLIIGIGGVMGYIKSNSLASLISTMIFAPLLFVSALLLWKKQTLGAFIALASTIALDSFFTYKFLVKGAFLPSGLFALISLGVLALLILFLRSKKA